MKRFFVPDRDGGAWLVYDRATGQGVGIICGPMKPHSKAKKKMGKLRLPVRLAYIDLSLAPVVREFGLGGLRWDSKTQTVTANGN